MIEVPRDKMPQVDERDIGKLIVFAAKMGFDLTAGETAPETFTSHQEVDAARVKAMAETVLAKPILCTRDFEVIDGNHRLNAHVLRGSLVPYLKFNCSFVEALDMMAVFPFAYELKPTTPERN